MPVKAVVRALLGAVFIAAMASPALACKGTESLLRDDFTETDPAWSVTWPDTTSFDIADGKVEARADPGTWASMWYDGDFFPAADACVDITLPDVRDPSAVWALAFTGLSQPALVNRHTPANPSGVR